MKKQTILLTVVFDEEETHGNSAAHAISHSLFNEDGIVEWNYKVLKEESMNADIAEEDINLAEGEL